ncbi:hypothetical protein BX666DRAFT_1354732 [Dichotomocladium elegans]|nr:hypothetical protein BX666DRAFT_1354732 [Dichotomocladium elegans]
MPPLRQVAWCLLLRLFRGFNKAAQGNMKDGEPVHLHEVFERLTLEGASMLLLLYVQQTRLCGCPTTAYEERVLMSPGKSEREPDDYNRCFPLMPLAKKKKIEDYPKAYRTINLFDLVSRWQVLASIDIPVGYLRL